MVYFKKGSTEITLEDSTNEFSKVKRAIRDLMYKLGDDCENITINDNDLDQDFIKSQYIKLLDKLDDVHSRLEYLAKPVVEQGFLKHNEDGRYELPSGDYFTSGSICEILYNDERHEEQYWIFTRIEHNGEDYYSTSLGRDISINGMMARVRR